MGQLRERGLPGVRDDAIQVHQHHEPGEHGHEQADHQREDGARVARGRRWKAGTALEIASMPVIAVAPEENARRTNRTVMPSIGSRPTTGVGAKPRRGGVDQPDGDQREHGQHERVGRRGEDRAGLTHAAQVARQQDRDRRESQRYRVVSSGWARPR